MSLNDDFLTDEERAARTDKAQEELFANEFGTPPISIGNMVGDDSSPSKFFVNPNPNEIPVLLEDLKLIESLESALDDLNDLRITIVQNGGIDRAMAASMESFVPELLARRPLNSFSLHQSITNYQISLEEIDKKRLGIYAGLTAALMAIVWKIYKWLFGKKEGSSSDATSSVASGEAVEARTEMVVDAAETSPIVEQATAVIAERHRENSEVTKARRNLDAEIKQLLDNSTEGKTIGFLGKSSEIQEIYRLIITSSSWNYQQIVHRLELLLDHIKAASDAIGNPSSPAFTAVLDAMRATGDYRSQVRSPEDRHLVTGGGGVGLNALVPAIAYRNPSMQVGKNVPGYVLRTGIMFRQKFIDIGSISYFFKDQSGLRGMIEAHDVYSRDMGQIYEDIKRLAESSIVTDYIKASREIERELKDTLPAIEKATEAADAYMKKLPKKTNGKMADTTPGIYNRDSAFRDDMAGTTHVDFDGDKVVPDVNPETQEPPVHGEGTAGVQPDGSVKEPRVPLDRSGSGDSTRYNAQYANHELIFRFLEHELRGKVREVTDWGAVLGFIARDISIINLRLTSKLMTSQQASLAEIRRSLTGKDDKGEQKDFVAEMDAKLLGILEMIIQKTKNANVTMADKPRKLWSIQGMLDKIVRPVSQFLGLSKDNHEKFNDAFATYTKALHEMADVFEKEFDSETANRLRAMAKSTTFVE